MNTEEASNLPILRDASPVKVISSGSAPPTIVRNLSRFDPDEDILAREAARYDQNRVRLNPKERAVLDAHQALADGLVLIDLAQTMRKYPEVGSGHPSPSWPLMGLARPTDKTVTCVRRPSGKVEFYGGELRSPWYNSDRASLRRQRPFYEVTVSGWDSNRTLWYRRHATVPPLPPELRGGITSDHRIIWLAEWEKPDVTPRPIRDPALLSHVAGGLYAVEAVWDVSPLEYAVLFGKEA